jgi:hypothetical protein
MATRSTIAVQHADGRVSQIYCHWDGYLSHNGKLLFLHYPTLERVEKLVSHGAISSLAEHIDPFDDQPAHTFDQSQKGVTVYYGRDRGEENCEPVIFRDMYHFTDEMNLEEYDYLFCAGQWRLRQRKGNFVIITPEMVGVEPEQGSHIGLVPIQNYLARFLITE